MTSILAYLDPGSAGAILQVIGGGVVALAVTLKLYGRKIFSSLRRARTHESEAGVEVGAGTASRSDAR